MGSYRLPPGANQVEMSDGTMIRGTGTNLRGRKIEAESPAHARAIERAIRMHGAIQKCNFTSPQGQAEKVCPCGFVAYSWQDTCPRCGGEL